MFWPSTIVCLEPMKVGGGASSRQTMADEGNGYVESTVVGVI
jgi:hypothetical protein